MYCRQESAPPCSPAANFHEPKKTVFDGLLGSLSHKHYKLCCRIQDMLEVYQHVYVQHVEISLRSQTDNYPGVDLGCVTECLRDCVVHRIHHAYGVELAETIDLSCSAVGDSYGQHEARIHFLLMMTRDGYRLLGEDERGSLDTLKEFIADAWERFQSLEKYHPGWMSSIHRVGGGFYLNDYKQCKGIIALSTFLESLP